MKRPEVYTKILIAIQTPQEVPKGESNILLHRLDCDSLREVCNNRIRYMG